MPKTLGKYEIVREIGRGGMGVVYLGRNEAGHERAVKVLPAQLALDPVFRQRFAREVKTLERLDHPNIVKIFDHGHHEGALWYAMEHVSGTNLEKEIRREQRLDPLRAARIMLEAARGLAYCHTRSVIHRDIKPANILMAEDGVVKLTDFGVARVTDATRMTATAGVLGTVEYMSPEQAGGRMVDERTDVYSLGVVFYQAVTGRLPIEGKNPSDVILKIQTSQVDAPSAWVPLLPRNVNDLILQMLEKDRAKRVLSAQALERELERICAQLESPKSAEDLAQPIVTGGKAGAGAWRALWPFFVIAFAAGAFIGAALFGRENPPPEPEAVLATAERLAGERSYHEASGLLRSLAARSDLAPEEVEALGKLREEIDRASSRNDVAGRVWIAAERAQRAGMPGLWRRLLEILAEDLPDTTRGEDARAALDELARPEDGGRQAEGP